MTDVILDVSHIAKTFGHVQALKDITLSLRKGRVHTLLGENGAGKSTLMKILAGVYPPTQGTITLRGETITINNPQHSRQLGIAIIFQELSLSNNMTVAENIYANNEPRRFGIINDKKMLADCQNLLAELGIPLDPLEMVGNMSMAHRQLVEIAKALSYAADVVIMDEPTSSLSDNEAEILFNIIEKLKQRGCAVIYISHRGDDEWFSIVRWTLFAMLNAEEMGINSQNVDEKAANPATPDMAHLLGKEGDYGKDLKLDNKWAFNIIKQVGNYSEIFERNVGSESPLKIKRGQNNLWNNGGIQYAPPVR